MNSSLPTLALGLILGIEHAFEADHLAAVSTMLTQKANPKKAALVGSFWGLGHTSTLLITGIIVLLLKISIPQTLSLALELLVGAMLVFLGVRVIYKSKKFAHIHRHKHKSEEHLHPHLHSERTEHKHHHSYLVGAVHGLAGSGALMLLVLTTVQSTIEGIYYILIFGLGSITGMTLTSLLLGYPFAYAKRKFNSMETYLNYFAGSLSIIIGIFIIKEIGFNQGLLLGTL